MNEQTPEDMPPASETPAPQYDQSQIEQAMDELRGEQNLGLGIVAGLGGAIIGAVAWAAITVSTGYQMGWIAIGVGFLVGIAVRIAGKGLDNSFGIAGAVFALFGCVLGNFLTICVQLAEERETTYMEVISSLDLEKIGQWMSGTFQVLDLLFYGIAVYEGYQFAFRRVTEEDVIAKIPGPPAG